MNTRRGLLLSVVLCLASLAAFASNPPARAEQATRADRVREMYTNYRERSFPGIDDLDPSQARALADSVTVVWLDSRTPRERRVSIIPGAVDRRAFEKNRVEWAGRPVIVYCTVGYRSGLATQELRNEGVEAFNLEGGILAWVHDGGAVIDGRTGEPTHRVHVYGWRWNLLPDGWRGIW